MSYLLPPEITHLHDIPYTLLEAIKIGLVYLSFEEQPKKDQPPREIYGEWDLLKEHFAAVDRRHKEEAEGNSSPDDVPTQQNDTEGLLGIRR